MEVKGGIIIWKGPPCNACISLKKELKTNILNDVDYLGVFEVVTY